MKLTSKKLEESFRAKEKYGNSKKMKSTITMRDTMKITMISTMKMATSIIMDMMTIIMKMVTIMDLTIAKKKFIILTEIITQIVTRKEQVEAIHIDKLFLDFKLIMEVISNLQGLTVSIKEVHSLLIENIIKSLLIINNNSRRKIEFNNLKKEQ